MEAQIFGVKKSSETRKALRYFSERRIKTHFVDFAERAPSEGELRRFFQRFGVDGLLDTHSRAFHDMGLGHARYGDERWFTLFLDAPLLLRMPLVRALGAGARGMTVGLAEDEWNTWIDGR